MKYHMNYDGKILPCRAKIKSCPYDDAHHGDSYAELYEVWQKDFNNVRTTPELADRLARGEKLSNMSQLESEIVNSYSPIEGICSGFNQALINAEAGVVSQREELDYNRGIQLARQFMESGRGTLPSYLPKGIRDTAMNQMKSNRFRNIFRGTDSTRNDWMTSDGVLKELHDNANYYQEIENKMNTQVMSKEELRNYKQVLTSQFNKYSNYLNTRKLLSQPLVAFDREDVLEDHLKQMSNRELLSLYDDCTVKDEAIKERLDSVSHFEYRPNNDLSEEANKALSNWFRKSRQAESDYIVASAQRRLVALNVAKVLMDRRQNFGDLSYNTREPKVAENGFNYPKQ